MRQPLPRTSTLRILLRKINIRRRRNLNILRGPQDTLLGIPPSQLRARIRIFRRHGRRGRRLARRRPVRIARFGISRPRSRTEFVGSAVAAGVAGQGGDVCGRV